MCVYRRGEERGERVRNNDITCTHIRVSYRGWNFPSQPQFSLPRNLEIGYGYYIIYYLLNISTCHQNVCKFCPRLHQKWSERYTKLKFSWGGNAPRPCCRHGCISHPIILLPSCFPPPTQNLVLYETLHIIIAKHKLTIQLGISWKKLLQKCVCIF